MLLALLVLGSTGAGAMQLNDTSTSSKLTPQLFNGSAEDIHYSNQNTPEVQRLNVSRARLLEVSITAEGGAVANEALHSCGCAISIALESRQLRSSNSSNASLNSEISKSAAQTLLEVNTVDLEVLASGHYLLSFPCIDSACQAAPAGFSFQLEYEHEEGASANAADRSHGGSGCTGACGDRPCHNVQFSRADFDVQLLQVHLSMLPQQSQRAQSAAGNVSGQKAHAPADPETVGALTPAAAGGSNEVAAEWSGTARRSAELQQRGKGWPAIKWLLKCVPFAVSMLLITSKAHNCIRQVSSTRQSRLMSTELAITTAAHPPQVCLHSCSGAAPTSTSNSKTLFASMLMPCKSIITESHLKR